MEKIRMSEQQDPVANQSPEQRRALLAELLKEKARQQTLLVPASDGQRALWFTQQSAPQSYAYHVSFSARVCSSVNVAHLQKAVQAVVNRHASLRTTYRLQDNQLMQKVHHYQEAAFQQVDGSGWDDARLHERVVNSDHQPFDLENGPLIRWSLFTRAEKDHIFLITAHHIAIDAWSLWIVLEDLRQGLQALANGEPIHLAPAPLPYTDWSKWQSEMLAGPEGEELKTFWQQQLAGDLPLLNLPYDFPHPLIQSHHGDTVAFITTPEQTRRLKALAQSNDVTLYMLMLAAFQVLMHRYTGQDDILVGTPTSGRNQSEFQPTVGYFVNPVTLRGNLSGSPGFRAYLAQVRKTVLEALEHQDYPFIRLVEQLRIRQDPSRSAVFQCMFNLHSLHRAREVSALVSAHNAGETVDFGGLQLERYFFPQEEGQFEVALEVIDAGETLACSLRYQTDIFRRATIEQLTRSFETLLVQLLEDPGIEIDRLPILAPDERQRILVDWNQTQAEYPRDQRMQQLFEAQVERTPDAVAVVFEDQSLTYRELNRRANQLAHHLRALGVGTDERVGIFLERSLEMVTAVLGVLKSGGAYVPMDPIYPPQRIQGMIADSQMRVLVSQQSLIDSLPQHSAQLVFMDEDARRLASQPDTNPAPTGDSDSLAYVIFTSGSTGRPKGVQISHRALVNFLCSMLRQPGIQPDDVLACVTTLSFDIVGIDLYLPLIQGARLVVLSTTTATDGFALAEALEHYNATILQATPVTWRLLIETGWQGKPDLKMLCCGEPLPYQLAQQLLARGRELWNGYGPTETTIYSSLNPIYPTDELISIGRPLANTQIYILDANLQPVPAGVTGTLYIGGDGLARGYLNQPELTAEKFIPHPFEPGARIYNSGDLARFLPDGRIEHLGRADTQVKIRGFRIELGEIEAVLNQHPAVKQAVVTVREDTPGEKRLVGYYISESSPTPRELSKFLREKLPAYMIPAAYIAMVSFPQTPNGKVDRKALPAPAQTSVESLLRRGKKRWR
jgi:amino acid adenylation domain-containing protein